MTLDGRVVVVGLGLMGGSVARTLKRVAPQVEVDGVDPDPVAGARALDAGVIARYDAEGSHLVAEADTVVLAAPLKASLGAMGELASALGPQTVVTDVVSLKRPLLARAESLGLLDRFVGAHPMCGSEASGFGASRDDLFKGAPVWLVAHDDVAPQLRAGVEDFWTALGCEPRWTEAREHDERMAWISHLPQLVSNALAGAIHAAGYSHSDLGPGGRDMTRLAGSSPEMWKDLMETSAPTLGTGLTSVGRALQVVGDLLARREVDRIAEFMERTRGWQAGEGE
ncbi:MAG: prephenate dehydrogenase/arogenate dehydrogenase family protein [Gemmatimonadales bacterium]|nr:MAG: prephenate dehydrogenase/arogenate dehydrogenase family protein [Gemmatimonadales bacterium]